MFVHKAMSSLLLLLLASAFLLSGCSLLGENQWTAFRDRLEYEVNQAANRFHIKLEIGFMTAINFGPLIIAGAPSDTFYLLTSQDLAEGKIIGLIFYGYDVSKYQLAIRAEQDRVFSPLQGRQALAVVAYSNRIELLDMAGSIVVTLESTIDAVLNEYRLIRFVSISLEDVRETFPIRSVEFTACPRYANPQMAIQFCIRGVFGGIYKGPPIR